MWLPVDDEIYQVNSVWLGPRGTTLPWRARYSAYGVGATIFLLILWAERRLGVPVGLWTLAYDLVGTIGATRAVMRSVDHDRPVRVMLAVFGHELSAPREQPAEIRTTFHPSQVRIRAHRPERESRPRPAAAPPQAPTPTSAPVHSHPAPVRPTVRPVCPPVPVVDVRTLPPPTGAPLWPGPLRPEHAHLVDVSALPPPTGAPIRPGPPLPHHAHLLTPEGSHVHNR